MSKVFTSPLGSFKIHPRGFLGSVQAPTIKRENGDINPDSVSKPHFDLSIFDASKSDIISANMAIDGLYRELAQSKRNNFGFRERVLRAALQAFGTNEFYRWYLAQYQSPAFGVNNRAFLEDTFKFLNEGRRNLPLSAWRGLCQASETNTGDHNPGPEAAKFFNINALGQAPLRNYLLPDIIQIWNGQEGGFNDLIGTLDILFGLDS